MAINSLEEYEKVINVSWFIQDQPIEELACVSTPHGMHRTNSGQVSMRFAVLADVPAVLHRHKELSQPVLLLLRRSFSALGCYRRNTPKGKTALPSTQNCSQLLPVGLLTRFEQSLDELLTEKVCQSLVERLSSQYLGQIVQILINLEHFEIACQELEQLLIRARSSTSAGGPLKLKATEKFRNNKKTAEKRIFELVNSKIDDLVDTAEYDWYAWPHSLFPRHA